MRERKRLEMQREENGQVWVVRFWHPLQKKTIRLALGHDEQEAAFNLKKLNTIFLDSTLWQNPPADTPDDVKRIWGDPLADVRELVREAKKDPKRRDMTNLEVAKVIRECEENRIAAEGWRLKFEQLEKRYRQELGRKFRTGPLPSLNEALKSYKSSLAGRDDHYIADCLSKVSRFIRDFGEETPADKLEGKESEIENWLRGLKIGPKTRTEYRRSVLSFLKCAGVQLDAKAIQRPSNKEVERERGAIRFLNAKQAHKVADGLKAYWQDLFRFQTATGLRPDELLTLKRSDFNPDFSLLVLSPLILESGTKLTLKTGSRQIPVSEEVRGIIRRRLKSGDVVFPRPSTGKPWDTLDVFHNKFRSALNKAGNKTKVPFRLDCRVGRRTFCSLLRQAGVSDAQIARVAGTSAQMIEKHYGHLSPDKISLKAAASAVA